MPTICFTFLQVCSVLCVRPLAHAGDACRNVLGVGSVCRNSRHRGGYVLGVGSRTVGVAGYDPEPTVACAKPGCFVHVFVSPALLVFTSPAQAKSRTSVVCGRSSTSRGRISLRTHTCLWSSRALGFGSGSLSGSEAYILRHVAQEGFALQLHAVTPASAHEEAALCEASCG